MLRRVLHLLEGAHLDLAHALARDAKLGCESSSVIGSSANRIRQIIAVNLPLGLLVVVIGGSGHYWG